METTMTKDKARKSATRTRAGGTHDRRTEMSYTEAHRTDPQNATQDGSPEGIAPTAPGVLPIDELDDHLATAESMYRSDDPYKRAAGYTHAARLYTELAQHAADPTWTMAAIMAGQMYDVLAARTRFENGIPTLRPKTEAANLYLGNCHQCGRPWQGNSNGACEHCPRLLFGVSSRKAPPGQPVNLADLQN
jgi:hypothetical protein